MASSSTASTASTQCGRYVQRRIQQAELTAYWLPRIEAALWVNGNLTMQDYFLLKSDPGLVKSLYPRYRSGDIDVVLSRLTDDLKNLNRSSLRFYRLAFRHDTLERDLPELKTGMDPSKAIHVLEVAVEFGHQQVFEQLLPSVGLLTKQRLLDTAFTHKRWAMMEVLVAAPHNIQPTLKMVIKGGRLEDVARFNMERLLLNHELNLGTHGEYALASTSPALFDFWYEGVRVVAGGAGSPLEEMLTATVACMIEEPNLELLYHLESTYPELATIHITRAVDDGYQGDRDMPLTISTVIDTGNARLIELVFRNLNRYQELMATP